MDKFDWFCITLAVFVPTLMFLSGFAYNTIVYVIKPNKTLKQGFLEWYHADDFKPYKISESEDK